jgi:hypothetical protein
MTSKEATCAHQGRDVQQMRQGVSRRRGKAGCADTFRFLVSDSNGAERPFRTPHNMEPKRRGLKSPPNAEAHGRRSRTVQPIVGSLDGDK